MVREAVTRLGVKDWAGVAKEVNARGIGRKKTGKQARARWVSCLDPKISQGAWTPAEERALTCFLPPGVCVCFRRLVAGTIRKLQADIGNKWAEIAKQSFSVRRPGFPRRVDRGWIVGYRVARTTR